MSTTWKIRRWSIAELSKQRVDWLWKKLLFKFSIYLSIELSQNLETLRAKLNANAGQIVELWRYTGVVQWNIVGENGILFCLSESVWNQIF